MLALGSGEVVDDPLYVENVEVIGRLVHEENVGFSEHGSCEAASSPSPDRGVTGRSSRG